MSRGDGEADEPAKCVTFLYIDTFVIACVSRLCTMCALKKNVMILFCIDIIAINYDVVDLIAFSSR